MKLAFVLVLLVIGSILFHFYSPWWFTPVASNWVIIDDTINITFWVTGIVFVLVNLFVAYAIYRFRYDKNRKAAYEPENKKLEVFLTVVTSLGIAIMLAPGLMVWAKFVEPPENAAKVEIVGQQWQWTYRFPGKDKVFGRTDRRLFSIDNPFGLEPNDENGQDDILVTSNELHLPLGQAVKMLLRSKDVLHNFAVPQFRVKMDLVPGTTTFLWLTPTREGRFDVLCQELCGMAHFTMRGHVVVEAQPRFEKWLEALPTFAQTQLKKTTDLMVGQALYTVCSSCHGQRAEGRAEMNAPALAGLSGAYIRRQLAHYKAGIRGGDARDVFGQQMAAMGATLVDSEAVDNVAAYIATLQGEPGTQRLLPTLQGNAVKGQHFFQNCSSCHGKSGEGNESSGAPKLAGQHDWYLKRQLENFKNGVRGVHSKDQYGQQMRLMAKVLKSEQTINDLVAYVSTL